MESLTNAELFELATLVFSELELQFQYWLSVTFALLVASFVARKQLFRNVRITIAFLYTLSTAIAIYRYISLGGNGSLIVDELATRGIPWRGIDLRVGLTRIALMVLGTLATLWFLHSTYTKSEAGISESET